jgi:hypothetical protein
LELFVGGLQLLVGGLELFVGRFQLPVGLLELVAQAVEVGDVEEGHAHTEQPVVRRDERCDVDVVVEDLAAAAAGDVVGAYGAPFRSSLVDQTAELERAVGDFEIAEGTADVAGRGTEQHLGLPADQCRQPVGGHHDVWDRGGERSFAAQRLDPAHRDALRGGGLFEQAVAVRRARGLAERAVLEVEGLEQCAVAEQPFGLAEEEHPGVGECEVEPRQDPRLRLSCEVHQRVAAAQEVDPGNGRVLDEVVAAEDDRAAQILAEDVPAVGRVEVAVEQVPREAPNLAVGVGAVAGVGERLVVDVGGVDLDAVAELRGSQHLGQHHRERVRLLAGRAARAPHPQRLSGCGGGEQGREHLLAEHQPGLRIAEEPRDVDQDRVEEGGELTGVQLEMIEVVRVVGDAHLGHPALDPAHQA